MFQLVKKFSLNSQAARNAGVPVILDAGGMDAPLPQELLKFVDILSPNESELSRLTEMPTETFQQVHQAVTKCYELVRFVSLETILPSLAVLVMLVGMFPSIVSYKLLVNKPLIHMQLCTVLC